MFFWITDVKDISEEDMKGFVRFAVSECLSAHVKNQAHLGELYAKGRLEDMVATHEMWLKASKAVLENPGCSVADIIDKLGL